jgi:voltage-gated potassium channel
MNNFILSRVVRQFAKPAVALVVVLAVGTVGYLIIGGASTPVVDALYMTFITIATIGYGEVIDMTGKPYARIFTMCIGFAGIGVTSYIFSKVTAFIIAGEFNAALRRRKMLKRISELSGHYIICGAGRVGANVAHELEKTNRPYVLLDVVDTAIKSHAERYPHAMHILGDATEDEMLEQAGIKRAAGLFSVTGDDNRNLVITLTAKQINASCRVVARCHEMNYFSKMERVGADAIVSPDFTGGMRIVSSMVRPHVVDFLDEMLRADGELRVEEVSIGAAVGATVAAFAPLSAEYIVLALRSDLGAVTIANDNTIGLRSKSNAHARVQLSTQFNPQPEQVLRVGDIMVVMATPAGRHVLEKRAATGVA